MRARLTTFAVGSLSAGDAGSVVFAVAVNSSVPAGTTVISNAVSISDAAYVIPASNSQDQPFRSAPPAAYKLIFGQQRAVSTTHRKLVISPAVTVNVQDQYGSLFSGGTSTTVTLTHNGGTFVGGSNTATASTVNGVATFSNLRISSGGTYTLTATDGALINITSSQFFLRSDALANSAFCNNRVAPAPVRQLRQP